MIELENHTDLPVDRSMLEKIAASLSTKEVELLIVNDKMMQEFNSTHRGKKSSTDVLSFPLEAPFTEESAFGMPLGSIVICDTFVKEQANALGHSKEEELALLFIHGMLHLLGFDHEADNGEMRKKEEALIEAFHLPKSLIVRTEN